ncbi:MAG TPA: PAS domain S-box protein [Candidatus Thermoplasmatota archaeon]|nr:PAS domain S-box protein [Candidatus Thermoplasmatota archaeon]
MSYEEKKTGEESDTTPRVFYTPQNTTQVEQTVQQTPESSVHKATDTSHNGLDSLGIASGIDIEKNPEISKDLSEKYRLIALFTSDLIAFTTFDINPLFTFVSPSHKKILGFETEELLGKSGLDFIHEDDREHILTILLTYIDAKVNNTLTAEMMEKPPKLDFRFRDKADQWHFLQSTVDIVKNELLFISKDITEQKQMEKELHESHELFSKAFLSSPEMITINSLKDGRYVDANESFIRTTGYRRDEIIGHSSTELNLWVDPRDHERFVRGLKEQGAIRNLEVQTRKKTGEIGFIMMSSEIIDLKGEPCVLTISTNISERKRTELKLLESEKRLHTIIQGLSIAAFFLGNDHKIIYWNTALEELSHIRAQDIIGTTDHWKAFYPQQRPCMADILIDGTVSEIEKWYVGRYTKSSLLEESYEGIDFFPHLGNGGKWLRFAATSIRNTDGELIGALETLEDISERKKAEIALQESEKKYRLLFDSASDGIAFLDLTGEIIDVNETILQIIGGTREELIGKHIEGLDFLSQQHVTQILKNFTSIIDGKNATTNISIRNKQGVVKYLESSASIVMQDGKKIGVIALIHDATTRKHAEQALETSEEKFVKAFQNSPIAISITRLNDGKFIEINEAFEKFFGYSRGELFTQTTIEAGLWFDVNDRASVVSELSKVGSIRNRELRFTTKGGIVKIARCSAEVMDVNNERCFLSVLVDVTEQKRIEESLQENEAKYRGIVENSKDLIMLTLADGTVSYLSPACSEVLGYEVKDLVGTKPEIFYPGDVDKVHETLTSALQGKSGTNFEYRILTKDGKVKWVSHTWSPIYSDDQKIKYIVSVVRDVSESKIFEQSLKEKIQELEQYKNVTVNREIKMVELKEQIAELRSKLNEKSP